MNHLDVRKKFFDFFEKAQHHKLPSSSLIPQQDPSILFVNAGMNQFKDIFLSLKTPKHKNVVTIQKCLRAGGKHNDIEDVGQTHYHHTFFEMLGNFSFGSYFKKQAIALAWEFLTQKLNIPPEHLWISVYKKDSESYNIWRDEHHIPEHKIYLLGEADNFWQMGDSGPCGPCSEIHYYNGKDKKPRLNQLIEIWNLVFMEFYDINAHTRKKLAQPCIDTGMGLERLCAILQNKTSNYHSDLFANVLLDLQNHCNYVYDFKEQKQTDQQKAFRVLADHSRSVSFLISDGLIPGNEKENYVLRRIMRRALYYSEKLNSNKNLLQIGIESVISLMSQVYPNLKKESSHILDITEQETKMFFDNLKKGHIQLKKVMNSMTQTFLPAKEVWNLYSTYGFPTDLTRLIVKEKHWTISSEKEINEYKKNNTNQNNNTNHKTDLDILKYYSQKLISQSAKLAKSGTEFTGYEKDQDQSRIYYIACPDIKNDKKILELTKTQGAWLLFDKSCFYPESGGPIGDRGFIKTKTGQADIIDCKKTSSLIWHKVIVTTGFLKKNQDVCMRVNSIHRQEIAISHTATHLINQALRLSLGNSVKQAGSLVKQGYLRFDFTQKQAVNKELLKQIERILYKNIQQEDSIFIKYQDLEQAKKSGVLFLQGENYHKKVRVVSVGTDVSKELCGGIHVKNTKNITSFKIINEKGVQAGVRRLEAYTGLLAQALEIFLVQQNLQIREYLKQNLIKTDTQGSELFHKKSLLWQGHIETINPFVAWMQCKDQNIKNINKQIVNLDTNVCKIQNVQAYQTQLTKTWFHPLAIQTLEFRDYLNLKIPDEHNVIDFLLHQDTHFKTNPLEIPKELLQKCHSLGLHQEPYLHKAAGLFKEDLTPLSYMSLKQIDMQNCQITFTKMQKLELNKDHIKSQAKSFVLKNINSNFFVMSLPVSNKKTLSEISNTLLNHLSSAVVILCGDAQGIQKKYPVVVTMSKDLSKHISAGDILKRYLAPLCKGQGGGKPIFAQGSITDKQAFDQVQDLFLKQWIL